MNKKLTSSNNDKISSQNQTQDQKISDLVTVLEHQMKDIWAQYVNCLNQCGQIETAEALREKYFKIYRNYKNNKEWHKEINK